jgi:hypothetical protein
MDKMTKMTLIGRDLIGNLNPELNESHCEDSHDHNYHPEAD